jgi:hypothetical protein
MNKLAAVAAELTGSAAAVVLTQEVLESAHGPHRIQQ